MDRNDRVIECRVVTPRQYWHRDLEQAEAPSVRYNPPPGFTLVLLVGEPQGWRIRDCWKVDLPIDKTFPTLLEAMIWVEMTIALRET